jgi:hypothetical protein
MRDNVSMPHLFAIPKTADGVVWRYCLSHLDVFTIRQKFLFFLEAPFGLGDDAHPSSPDR